jgi:alginate O-acetyltransferase complex protein AlgI
MLFNSSIFIFIFLPIALLGWYNIKNLKGRLIFMTIMSSVFYGYWDYRFVLLMMGSIIMDYYCGKRIAKFLEVNKVSAKRWVIASIIVNLCILGFFKYFNFFIDNIYSVLPVENIIKKPALEIILPVGISFYIFESMTYSIDIYRGIAKPAESIFHLSAYISMFPRLNAGPIVRYSQIEEQLRNISSRINYDYLAKGLFIFTLGLFRKIFIADFFAEWSDIFFDAKIDRQFFVSWAGTLSYTFQIYFDFSAYCEMAFGLGIMLGFDFPRNFNSPYKARSFSDFWKRWHIALSEFLRDYLYIPLGGNKVSKIKMYRNLLITMILGGLWHGASWMFIIWGVLHGSYLVIERLINPYINLSKLIGYRVLVFICVCLAWIFFRSTDLNFAIHTFKSCLMLNGFETADELYKTVGGLEIPSYFRNMGGITNIIALIIAIIFVNILPNVFQLNFKKNVWVTIVTAIMFYLCLLNIEKPSPFIYFQF